MSGGTAIRDLFVGIVRDNADPERRGRLTIESRDLAAEGVHLPGWVEPCFPFAGSGAGWLAVPPVGTPVEVEAVVGHTADDTPGQALLMHPQFRWRCAIYAKPSDVPTEFRTSAYPQRLGLKSPGGRLIMLDDEVREIVLAGFDKLKLGSESSAQKLVLGGVLTTMLSTVLAAIAVHTHIAPAGGGITTVPNNAATFTAQQASPVDDGAMLSDIVVTEK